MVTSSLSGRELVAEWAARDAKNAKMSDRTKLERRAGRARNIQAAATALISEICKEYGITAQLAVDTSSDEEADWGIALVHDDFKLVDRWADFPSEEFRTALMLLGMTK
jgi:hypothetical protein